MLVLMFIGGGLCRVTRLWATAVHPDTASQKDQGARPWEPSAIGGGIRTPSYSGERTPAEWSGAGP